MTAQVAIRFHQWQPLPGEAELRSAVREFLARQHLDVACDNWLSGVDPDFSRTLGSVGYIGMTIPREYGGHGRSALERYVVIEELLAVGAPVGAHWIADRQTAPLLLRYGTEVQRRRFLPAIARGECFFSVGMSEPEAGSDLSAVRTTARRMPGGYLVNGQKIWTTNAQHSHYLIVLARTAATENPRAGLSQLLVDLGQPGVTVRPIELLNGSAHFNEVFLDDVFVPQDMLVGRLNAGWEQVMAELGYERSGPERLLSTFPLLVELVRRIGQDPGPVAAAALGRAVARLGALRTLSRSVAVGLDDGAMLGVHAALVKDLGTRQEQELIEVCRTAASGRGPGDDDAFERLSASALLAAPGFTLRGGTNEVLRGLVARGMGLR